MWFDYHHLFLSRIEQIRCFYLFFSISYLKFYQVHGYCMAGVLEMLKGSLIPLQIC